MVTTTVKEDGGIDIGSSLRETLRVPLSVVPLSVKPIEEEEEELDTQATLRQALKIPLAAVVPESVYAAAYEGDVLSTTSRRSRPLDEKERYHRYEEDEHGARLRSAMTSPLKESLVDDIDGDGGDGDSGGYGSGIDTSVVSGEIDPMLSRRGIGGGYGGVGVGMGGSLGEGQLSGSDSGSVTSKGSLFKFKKDSKTKKESLGSTKDSESDLTVIKVDIQSEDEETPPMPPPFTVWQILTRKRKLMSEMTVSNTIPTEEDLLDRFSVIDLYARRLFPSSFFILFTIYWILFNYYITDEFPHEKKKQ
ncbi:hypothetical protein Pcinc_033749 [Petrolisthes cinctipes]|uniref:Uncharacterized protein n=1 Tax=Petrolisthes cinctipes TaxID=88211 RepID=A0AAE1ERP6_PETCI|nr:hypothetical protein Pcinc_033749 [Petrolisthes cinctipes]